ncbi:MAG TPA: TIGR04255 family protein, partial [Gammaproteobacteria bacterium]|nr:TIGR04255 family protein [Gammaproteobacteria bacterium]
EPYQTWEEMVEEAKELWNNTQDIFGGREVVRIATRFINLMRIPLPITNFDDYLTAGPKVPEKLPQGISSFITRIVIQNPEIDAAAFVTQALESTDQLHAPITLDIDVVKQINSTISEMKIWETMERLRDFKNDVFFESITERTAELFQ